MLGDNLKSLSPSCGFSQVDREKCKTDIIEYGKMLLDFLLYRMYVRYSELVHCTAYLPYPYP